MSSKASPHVRIGRECHAVRLRALGRVVSKVYDDALRPFGLRATQLNVLAGVAGAGPVRSGELARWLHMEKSTLSRDVDRLIERGWIEVRSEDGDERTRVLRLTPAGDRMLTRVTPAWEQAQLQTDELLGKSFAAALRTAFSSLKPV